MEQGATSSLHHCGEVRVSYAVVCKTNTSHRHPPKNLLLATAGNSSQHTPPSHSHSVCPHRPSTQHPRLSLPPASPPDLPSTAGVYRTYVNGYCRLEAYISHVRGPSHVTRHMSRLAARREPLQEPGHAGNGAHDGVEDAGGDHADAAQGGSGCGEAAGSARSMLQATQAFDSVSQSVSQHLAMAAAAGLEVRSDAVPTACDAEPTATPVVTSSLTRQRSSSHWPDAPYSPATRGGEVARRW